MNERFDDLYEIRLATVADIDSIMSFISENWNSQHLLAMNRDFFEFEFREGETVNFIVAIDKNKQSIEGIYGFLRASHDREHMDVWGSFLKTRSNNVPLLGVEMIKRRTDIIGCRNDIGVGANPLTTIPIMKLLKRFTAKMDHYYILSNITDFKIAQVQKRPVIKRVSSLDYSVCVLNNIDEVQRVFDVTQYKDKSPYKDYWYINHRFFAHPIYNYTIYGIEKEGQCEALIVLRMQEYEDRIAVRFVDYIGNEEMLAGTFKFWQKLLCNERYEYVDFYCCGISRMIVEQAGFTLLNKDDLNIIPNYFNPFERKNIDIWVQSTAEDTRFTKADGDQDRPN